jgi:YbbR domain-containing protein
MFSRLRSILFKNWIPKLACLAFAFGLWFWVAIQQTGQSQYEVPVEFRNKPQDLYITDQSTRNVIVTLQGPKTSLYRTSSSDITASIDLRGQSEGTKTFWSSELTIRQPKGLQVYDISPQNIRVKLVNRSEKTVPVEPRVEGDLPEGFRYGVSVDPDTAILLGANDTLRDIQSLDLSSVALDNRNAGTETLDLRANVPSEAQLQYPETNSFQLTLSVTEETIRRTISEIPVTVTGVPAGQRALVEPPSVELEVRGPQRTVEDLRPEDIDVTVPAPEKGSGLKIRVADVSLPENVELVNEDGAVSAMKVKLESL